MTGNQSLPNVTVVVPNYNHARYLPESLGSIAGQTRAPDQVIVIDDGSTDDSVEVIERIIAGRMTWTLIRYAERRGVIARLNDGLTRARGEWVVFLGADDALLPHFIERALRQAEKEPMAGLVSACAEVVNGSGGGMARPAILPRTSPGYVAPTRFQDLLAVGDNFFYGTVTLYRREALASLDGFDPALGSAADGLVARRLAARFGFSFVPEVLGYWRHHGENLSIVVADDSAIGEQLIARAKAILAAEPPGLFPSNYAATFERRVRFGWARIQILSASAPRGRRAAAIGRMTGAGQLEQWLLRTTMGLGALGRLGALGWIALRLRPFSLLRLGLEPLRRSLLIRSALLSRCPEREKIGDIKAQG